MPLTDIADLRERMTVLLSAAAPSLTEKAPPEEGGSESQSLITAPMPELNAAPRSFADIYGTGGGMLAQLGLEAAQEGAPELASLLSALDVGLREGAFDLPSEPRPAPRLSPYVYPVI